jgi:hypothetical protein
MSAIGPKQTSLVEPHMSAFVYELFRGTLAQIAAPLGGHSNERIQRRFRG